MPELYEDPVVDDLVATTFFSTVLNDTDKAAIVEPLQQAYEETGRYRVDRPIALPPTQYYCHHVLQRSTRILSAFERLRECEIFLTDYTPNENYTRLGITQYRWMEYHYSLHVLTRDAINDMSALLVSDVYRLGLDERDCRMHILRRNEHLEGTSALEALEAIDRMTQPIRQIRNEHLHRGKKLRLEREVGEDELEELFDSLDLMSNVYRITGEEEFNPRRFKRSSDTAAERLQEATVQKKQRLGGAVKKMFDALHSAYRWHLNQIRLTTSVMGQTLASEE